MKKTISLLAAAFALQAAPAFAIVGGPWDNDNFNPTNSGTYQAAIFLRNGAGMARFSDTATGQFSAVNQSIIYYRGIVYEGSAFGFIDHNADTVIGITNGFTQTGAVDSDIGRNVDICNTQWTCRIREDAPVMRFSGKGEASFFGVLSTFQQTSSTTQVIVSPDGLTTTTVQTDTTDFGGEDSDFPKIGARAKLWVFGSQISISV